MQRTIISVYRTFVGKLFHKSTVFCFLPGQPCCQGFPYLFSFLFFVNIFVSIYPFYFLCLGICAPFFAFPCCLLYSYKEKILFSISCVLW